MGFPNLEEGRHKEALTSRQAPQSREVKAETEKTGKMSVTMETQTAHSVEQDPDSKNEGGGVRKSGYPVSDKITESGEKISKPPQKHVSLENRGSDRPDSAKTKHADTIGKALLKMGEEELMAEDELFRNASEEITATMSRVESALPIEERFSIFGTPEEIVCFIDSTQTVQRSKEGRYGVLFLDASIDVAQIGRRVIKFIDDPLATVAADQLFSQTGFISPQSVGFSFKSREGTAVRNLIDQHFGPPSQAAQREIDYALQYPSEKGVAMTIISMHHREHQAQAQKTLNTHVLYMTYLDALSWRKAPRRARKAAMKNPQFVKDLGRMILFDTFMGNTDRLSESHFNEGNIMLSKQGAQYQLAVIDNEINLNEDNMENIEAQLVRLISTDGMEACEKIAKELLFGKSGAYESVLPEGAEASTHSCAKTLSHGIMEGAKELSSIIGDQESYNEIFGQLTDAAPAIDYLRQVLEQEINKMEQL